MVSILDSGVVAHEFIGGVMVSMLFPGVVAREFIGGVMVSMLDSGAVAREIEPRSGQTKTIKLVFVASTLSTQI